MNSVLDSIEFTGERYIPGLKGIIELEHLHRYLQACSIADGKVVLDIASGEGYGSAMLSDNAAKVIGIDISLETVKHARNRYKNRNLEFMVGSCSEIPLPDSSVDIVVSFETIEHHNLHDEMMLEIKRVLRSDGILVISSPDKYNYSVEPNFNNQFHIKELYEHEFKNLINKYFTNSIFYGQRIIYGSGINSFSPQKIPFQNYWREDSTFKNAIGLAKPTYWIAIASNSVLPELSTGILEEKIEESENYLSLRKVKDNEIALLNKDIDNFKQRIAELSQVLDVQNDKLSEQNNSLNQYSDNLNSLQQTIAERNQENNTIIQSLTQEISERDSEINTLNQTLSELACQFETLNLSLKEELSLNQTLNAKIFEIEIQLNTLRDELNRRDELIENLKHLLAETKERTLEVDDKNNEFINYIDFQTQLLANRDGEIFSLSQDIEYRACEMAAMDKTILEKNKHIESLHNNIEDNNCDIANLKEQITNLNLSIQDRDTYIASINNLLSQRDDFIFSTKNANSALQGELASINLYLRRIQAPQRLIIRYISNILHPLKSYKLYRDIYTIKSSTCFDIEYYLSNYTDIKIRGCDPIRHYCEYGWKERRNPSSLFDTNFYLNNYHDVIISGVNPFVHYIKYGRNEGRIGIQAFDNLSDSSAVGNVLTTTYKNKSIENIQNNSVDNPTEINNVDTTDSNTIESYDFALDLDAINKSTCDENRIFQHENAITFSINNILVMDYRIPRDDISAGEQATVGLLTDLFEFGFNVVFMPNNMDPTPIYTDKLIQLGINVITGISGYNTPSDFILKHGNKFPLFYIIRVEVAESVIDTIRSVSPNSRIIFHAPDVYFIREGREAELKNNPALQKKADATRIRELSIMNQADHNVIVSSAELPILRNFLPDKPVSVFQVLHVSVINKPVSFNERRDIFFLGGFTHTPNVDAVCWFVSKIWPRIHKELPMVTFHIVGSEVTNEIAKLESIPGVVVIGYLQNLDPILSSMRLSVAPLRFGAGIKGKVATTMGAGIPVICTNIAAEGMYIKDGVHARVADDEDEFATAVIQTYKDKKLWVKLSKNGQELVQQHFSKEANKQSLFSLLNQARSFPIGLFIEYIRSLSPQKINITSINQGEVDVSIIIPCFNQWDFTRACVNSIIATTRQDSIRFEIILADDGSTDETINAAKYFNNIIIVRTPTNLGFLRNCNHAAKHAKGKYILLLNNDTIVLHNWLSSLYNTIINDETAGIVGSKLIYPDGTIQEAGGLLIKDGRGYNAGRGQDRNNPILNIVRETDYISAASIIIRKSLWNLLGGFDERYNNAYCEDSDLAFTVRSKGFRVLYQPDSEVVHFEHQSYAEESQNHFSALQKQNTELLVAKWQNTFNREHLDNAPWHLAMSNAERTVATSSLIRRRQGNLNILYVNSIPTEQYKSEILNKILNFRSIIKSFGYKVHLVHFQNNGLSESEHIEYHNGWDTVTPILFPMQSTQNNYPNHFDGLYLEGLGERIRILCEDYKIDVVICSYIYMSKLLEYIPSNILKVIDIHKELCNQTESHWNESFLLESFSCTPEEVAAYIRRADIIITNHEEITKYLNTVTGTFSSIFIPYFLQPNYIDKDYTILNKVGIVSSADPRNLKFIKDFIVVLDRSIVKGVCPFTVLILGMAKDIIDNISNVESALFDKSYIKYYEDIPTNRHYYENLDIVVSTISEENDINISNIHAMAFGMPMITISCGATGIETNDLVQSHKDIDTLVSSLFHIYRHPQELSRLANINQQKYTSYYETAIKKTKYIFSHLKLWKSNIFFNPIFEPTFKSNIIESTSQEELTFRKKIENGLIENNDFDGNTHFINCVCYLCGPVKMTFPENNRWGDVEKGFSINWQEHLFCPVCNFNGRLRATIHILNNLTTIDNKGLVYITEHSTELYSFLKSFIFPSIIGSEYLGNFCELGQSYEGVRNEDLTRLSFPDFTLSGILSFDVLEHIPNYEAALNEAFRCLKSGGQFIFSVPFDDSRYDTVITAEINSNGLDNYISSPEHHGVIIDPGKGNLCYQTFGWDLLDKLRHIGFINVHALDYWSETFGYLGDCLLFIANKP